MVIVTVTITLVMVIVTVTIMKYVGQIASKTVYVGQGSALIMQSLSFEQDQVLLYYAIHVF